MDDVVYRTLTVTVGEERRAEVERECQREHDDGELIGRLARLPEVAKVKWS
jgi:hypothetical protein